MKDAANRSTRGRGGISAGEILSYGAVVAAIVLGWQIVLQPLMQRAPAGMVLGLAPGSPLVLRRAAESELAAGRIDNAAALSRDALARAPFDARALRVIGLTEARAGRDDRADEILTLAGNWSLRDDPAHAWLTERRLRRGDYASAFAHADTLVRRRQDIQPSIFRLFTVAGTLDPQRAVPVLTKLLAARPPWRKAYLEGLNKTSDDVRLLATLAVTLQGSRAPFDIDELQFLYSTLVSNGQFDALQAVRRQIDRPPPGVAVTNGDFSDADAPKPFQWRLNYKVGIVSEIVTEDLRPSNYALRVDYDGYATGTVAEQLTSLPPGRYRMAAAVMVEAGNPTARLAWEISCATGSGVIASFPAGMPNAAPNTWGTLSADFEVPARCPAQWLRLETRADDHRSRISVWFDRITILPTG